MTTPEKNQNLIFNWGVSDHYGWGIYGANLLLLGQSNRAYLATPLEWPPKFLYPLDPFSLAIFSEIEERRARPIEMGKNDVALYALGNGGPYRPFAETSKQVGVTFFETNPLEDQTLKNYREKYAAVITGSTWNQQVLEDSRVRTSKVIQGIDTDLFRPLPKKVFRDRFVVFSGGKLESRKGQDIVVKAFSIFAKSHPESLLVTCWNSPWSENISKSINQSNLCVPFKWDRSHEQSTHNWLIQNGIDAKQFVVLGSIANRLMPEIYREIDLAIFPNRCEGGTNLVAMEALSSGLTCLISKNTGHLDLIQSDNCIPLEQQRDVKGGYSSGWGESSVEEILFAMESVYTGSRIVDPQAARRSVAAWTWSNAIDNLYDAILHI
jgi:glycosyltransferase involved in cell wall biosynthesis